MSVQVRPFRNGGFEVDIRYCTPDGRRARDRKVLTVNAKSAAQRWGEARERELLVNGPQQKQEVPTRAVSTRLRQPDSEFTVATPST